MDNQMLFIVVFQQYDWDDTAYLGGAFTDIAVAQQAARDVLTAFRPGVEIVDKGGVVFGYSDTIPGQKTPASIVAIRLDDMTEISDLIRSFQKQ